MRLRVSFGRSAEAMAWIAHNKPPPTRILVFFARRFEKNY
jgi:hypothetical protein